MTQIVEKLAYHESSEAILMDFDYPSAYKTPRLYHSIMGFHIPALPIARITNENSKTQLAQLFHRFTVFIRAFHNSQSRQAIALNIVSHPERSVLGSEVGIYLLGRVAHENRNSALYDTKRLATQIYQLFPTESLFNYGTPIRLSASELEQVTFQRIESNQIQIAEIRKYEDCLTAQTPVSRYLPQNGVDYIPHVFWPDTLLDPWLTLIEMMAGQTDPVIISLVLEPTTLIEHIPITGLAQIYRTIVTEGSKRDEKLEQAGLQGADFTNENISFLKILIGTRAIRAQGLTDYLINRAQQGMYVYNQLLSWRDHLFTMRISVAAQGRLPDELLQTVQAALSSPNLETPYSDLGWMRPTSIEPKGQIEKEYALLNLHWLGQLSWGNLETDKDDPKAQLVGLRKLRRLRSIVTPQEAVGLFHLPMIPQTAQITSAISTVTYPFVIPPEVSAKKRFAKEKSLLSFGYLYQRGHCLSPQEIEQKNLSFDPLPFQLPLKDMEKPSLLVGAPGSGKSNMALYLLNQLWRDHQVPFLVLDPSTGQEYRYLYAEPSLQKDLLVYTVGDEDGLPFRFNPFAVPPEVTVRSHITRLLACFKAAYELWDPLPAIYEAALARTYKKYDWSLDEKGGKEKQPSPCLVDFAQAISDELESSVLPDFGSDAEGAGRLTGSSKIIVKGILNSLGHIINVPNDDGMFFQTLLSRPVVIELGALGDPNSISLMMAFLITQLRGHIEYAAKRGGRKDKPHMLFIEEAHILLSAETSTNPNQGNVRGKSAEEMNSMLAEVRKFRQGIMVLDQRPSSLVGGVLDNSLINIMCRLNDRTGFEHLSNVLNLNKDQQRHARTRLKPGDALMLDAVSGQPVLMRSENIVDKLREGCERLMIGIEEQMYSNAERANLLPLKADVSYQKQTPVSTSTHTDSQVTNFISQEDDENLIQAIDNALEEEDWFELVNTQLRVWLKRNSNTRLKPVILGQVLEILGYSKVDQENIVSSFEETLT